MINVGQKEGGDTLVEVILSIALISLVLVSAFNIVGASYRSAMFAKERIEAISLAQQQAERIRYVRDYEANNGDVIDWTVFPDTNEILDAARNRQTCPASGCLDRIYNIKIQRVSPNAISSIGQDEMRTYLIQVEWLRAGSSEMNETSLEIKIANRNINDLKRDCSVVESCN